MSKKKTASKKSATKKTKRATSDRTAATQETSADTSDAPEDEAEDSASRLPTEGTVIKKVDRHGAVRCQCTVVEGGIRYPPVPG